MVHRVVENNILNSFIWVFIAQGRLLRMAKAVGLLLNLILNSNLFANLELIEVLVHSIG